jgi:SAM-dependent methyltransferase
MDWAAFEDWHAFVSGSGSTPYGDGLGLEVGDSFWIWSDTGAFALRHAPPWERSRPPAPEARRIVELARSGWLDTLHSFGDWNPTYQLTREEMLRGLELLEHLGIRPPVYVNHGGGIRLHNIGGPWASYQCGDDSASPYYNLDLLQEAGFRFFWIDTLFENDLLGDNMDPERLPPEQRPQANRRWMRATLRTSPTDPALERREAFPALDAIQAERVARFVSGNLLIPLVGRDSRAFWGFKRFRGHEAPTSASFALQASPDRLDLLEAAGGACVIYQHFGVWRELGKPKGDPSQIQSRRPLLDATAVRAFRDIARRNADGRLLVATTARLLGYLRLRDSLRFSVRAKDGGLFITIEGTQCPIFGHGEVSAQSLEGAAFLVPAGVPFVQVATSRGEVLSTVRAAEPCEPGFDAVHIPWRPLVFPALGHAPVPRITPDRRIGGAPPGRCQSVRHVATSPQQSARMLQMIDTLERDKFMTLNLREDLHGIASEWQHLPSPAVLQASAEYVRKMHAEPFKAYHDRLRRLTGGGGVALDAGSGTSTWSLPMADLFNQVIAVDKNRPRVDFARWLVARSGCRRIDVSYGDITDLDLDDASVDFVFCFGVVISYLSLRSVLREFRRVTRPGGSIYVCVNGIGWSQHLRDERGERSQSMRVQGTRGFYNTLCQTQQGDLNGRISKLIAHLASGETAIIRAAAAAALEPIALERFLTSCRLAKAIGDISLPGEVNGERIARVVDLLLVDSGLPGPSLAATLAEVARESGSDFVETFALDIAGMLSGQRDGFSYGTSGRGYAPAAVHALCNEIGLSDFRWAGEGELVGEGGVDVAAPRFFSPEYGGRLGVWEFLVRR